MIIEAGEKIWSSAAHQLRGRIGRGERESVCHIFTNSNSENTRERINALLKAKNGFELAEYDLNQERNRISHKWQTMGYEVILRWRLLKI